MSVSSSLKKLSKNDRESLLRMYDWAVANNKDSFMFKDLEGIGIESQVLKKLHNAGWLTKVESVRPKNTGRWAFPKLVVDHIKTYRAEQAIPAQ